MEVKTEEKVLVSNEHKADANVKDTARHEHNERLQNVRERKLQQLRYLTKNIQSLIQVAIYLVDNLF